MARLTKRLIKLPPAPEVLPWEEDKPSLVHIDFSRHTVIEVERTKDHVSYIPFDAEGLRVVRATKQTFESQYKPVAGYPVERAAKLYLSWAVNLGATLDVMKHLGRFVPVTQGATTMATNKKSTPPPPPAKKEAPKKAAKIMEPKKPAPSSKKQVAEPKKPEAKRTSAAQMFKDLIMEGKLTDQQIFHKVQEEFGLDDSRSGYVAWYRKDLKKKGLNPPEPKKEK